MNAARLLQDIRQKKLLDVWPSRDITWVATNCTLELALTILKEKKVLSLPVVNTSNNTVLGVIDIMDIATYIVARYPAVDQITELNLRLIQYNETRIAQETTVEMVIAFSKRYATSELPLFPISVNSALLDLMTTFSFGVHRVPIVDAAGTTIINFVSQSDLLRYLAENIYLLGNLAQKSINELGIGQGAVHYARADAPVVLALSHIASKRVPAVPVLDLSGNLTATLSASELRGIGPAEFYHLLRPISDFLAVFSPKALFPLTCTPDDTLEYVVLKLAATRVHRLWCVDQNGKVLGVVSLTDVMKPVIGVRPMEVEPFPTIPEPTFPYNPIYYAQQQQQLRPFQQ